MRFARIATYTYDPKDERELLRICREGLVPFARGLPGCLDLFGYTADGKGTATSIFEDEGHARTGSARISAWVQQNVKGLLTSHEVRLAPMTYGGEALAQGGVELVRHVYELWNARRLDEMAHLAAPGMQMTVLPFGMSLPFRAYEENWARGFPDGRIDLVSIAGDGHTVMAEFIGRGTQTGPLNGPTGVLPPTGKRVDQRFVEIYELENGLLARGRMLFDAAFFFRQLGVDLRALPAGAPAAATGAGQAGVRH